MILQERYPDKLSLELPTSDASISESKIESHDIQKEKYKTDEGKTMNIIQSVFQKYIQTVFLRTKPKK